MENPSDQSFSSDQSGLSERSDSTSYSPINRDSVIFHVWAHSVRLDTTIRERDTIPIALQDILHAGQAVPAWISNEKAPQYSAFRANFGDLIKLLSLTAGFKKEIYFDDDEELSRDVLNSLYPILFVPLHDAILCEEGSRPSAMDRRLGTDLLVTHAWGYQCREDFQFRKDFILRLPQGSLMSAGTVTVDSGVNFRLPNIGLPASRSSDEAAPISFVHDAPQGFLRLLHWIIAYECEECSDCAERRTLQGLVSELYQRRALGFLDHFVFGMAHHSTNLLDVLAAAWEYPKPIPAKTSTGNRSTGNDDGNEEEGDGMIGGEEGTNESSYERFKDPLHPEIVVYRLGTFYMASPLEMLRLYLLMRSTRALGRQYKNEIVNALSARVAQQTPAEFDQSPAASRSPSPTESSGRSRKCPRLQESEGQV